MSEPMTTAELIEGLKTLNAPNQGMRYHSGGYRRGDARFDPYTGQELTPEYRVAELNVYSDRAQFLYRLIQSAEALAAALGCSETPEHKQGQPMTSAALNPEKTHAPD